MGLYSKYVLPHVPVAGADSLRYAMLVTSAVTLWSAFHFWKAGQWAPGDLAAQAAQHPQQRVAAPNA